MLVQRRIVSLDEIPEAFTTAKRLLDMGGFPSNVCPEVSGVHSVDVLGLGAGYSHKELFASSKMQQTIAKRS
jgi:hypothetical protein